MSREGETQTTRTKNFLTVPEVAGRLDMTTNGVYKLIQRGKLMSIRKSERKTLVPESALRSYQSRLTGHSPDFDFPGSTMSTNEARNRFTEETGRSPESWADAWKSDAIEDSPENMIHTIHALSVLAQEDTSPKSRAGHLRGSSHVRGRADM
jgi:hypothetical protein